MLLVFSSSFLVTNFSFLTAAKPSRSLRANFLFGTVWWLFLIFFLFCQWVLRERQWSHLSPKNCPKSYEITPPMTAAGPIRSQPCSSFSLSFQTTRRRRSPGAAGAAPVAGCSEMEGRVEKWVREWECNKIRRRRSDRHIGTEVRGWEGEGCSSGSKDCQNEANSSRWCCRVKPRRFARSWWGHGVYELWVG